MLKEIYILTVDDFEPRRRVYFLLSNIAMLSCDIQWRQEIHDSELENHGFARTCGRWDHHVSVRIDDLISGGD